MPTSSTAAPQNWKMPGFPLVIARSTIEKWPRGTRGKLTRLMRQLAQIFQEAAQKGVLGDVLIQVMDGNGLPRMASDVALPFLLSCPAWRWPSGPQSISDIRLAVAVEGNEKALARLSASRFVRALPLRFPDRFNGKEAAADARWWTPLEKWLDEEATRKSNESPLRNDDGERIRPYTQPPVWSSEEKSRHRRMFDLLADSRDALENFSDSERGISVADTICAHHLNHLLPLLFKHGERLDVASPFLGSRPLHEALIHGNLVAAQALIDAGVDINTRSGPYRDGLLEESLNMPALEMVLTMDGCGDESPLLPADRDFFIRQTLPWFVNAGGRLDRSWLDEEDRSLLCIEWLSSDSELVTALLRHGARVHPLPSEPTDGAPLPFMLTESSFFLANDEVEESLLALIDAGADLLAVDEKGNTMLHLAAAHGAGPRLLSRLQAAGLDPFARNHQGETPLICAASGNFDFPATVEYLLSQGVELEATAADGETALLRSLHNSNPYLRPQSVELLLNAGANPLARNAQGESALLVLAHQFDRETESKGLNREVENHEERVTDALDIVALLKKTGHVWSDTKKALDIVANDKLRAALSHLQLETDLTPGAGEVPVASRPRIRRF